MSVILDGLPRSTPRATWRVLHRLARVAVQDAERAASQAMQDLCTFGTAFIWIPPDGQPEYVTISEAYERMEE